MLDIKLIREQPELVKSGVSAKGYSVEIVDQVIDLDKKRRELLSRVETLRAERNTLAKDQIDRGKEIKTEMKDLEPELDKLESQLAESLAAVPNLPLASVPRGTGEAGNVEIRRWGTPRQFDFTPKNHLELGTHLGILDFESGSKVTGSQFYYLYGQGVFLDMALSRYALDFLSKAGFLPVITPDLAKSRYYLGTGYQPKGDEAQTYTIEGEDLGLIATAEVTLAGKHADEIIPENQLPLKYVGYSHCFRKEAGAYGKYSKGLYRVHQFTKTEMFIYCSPEESEKMHEHILAMEEAICQSLGLPYRVVEMCTGDLGAMAARKFDLEVWMPGRNDYGEVTSTSNCTDYQARNLNIRFKRQTGGVEPVHMLNGTAIVMSRFPLAILENYQNSDGSVTVPDILRPYMPTDKIVPREIK